LFGVNKIHHFTFNTKLALKLSNFPFYLRLVKVEKKG